MVTMMDRRRHQRNQIDWPVSVYHPRLGMFVNGRSVDVSQSGAKISLPIAVPLRPGQVVELNFPRTSTLAKMAGCFSRIKTALVVRIEAESPASQKDSPAAGADPWLGVSQKRSRRQTVAVHFDKNALSLVR
ncbi:MAG: PilZ domain-containing protein [Phycisphaerae bacterium]|nr:PilZ domain-containing protein [Phycisphaerae bacterium]